MAKRRGAHAPTTAPVVPDAVDAVSAGGVVLTGGGIDREVALVMPARRRVWCLPKGALEPGETPDVAAVREVREETGLDAEIVDLLDDITYWFFARGTRVHKKVHFYLMRSLGGDPGQHDAEVSDVRWFPLIEAPEVLAYRGERSVVEQAIARLYGREHAER